jgi:predicted ABC-type ATPase
MTTLYMTKGLPGSGKTTWAKEMVSKSKGSVKRVNKDDLRAMLDAGEWSKENEKFVLKVRDFIIEKALDVIPHFLEV